MRSRGATDFALWDRRWGPHRAASSHRGLVRGHDTVSACGHALFRHLSTVKPPAARGRCPLHSPPGCPWTAKRNAQTPSSEYPGNAVLACARTASLPARPRRDERGLLGNRSKANVLLVQPAQRPVRRPKAPVEGDLGRVVACVAAIASGRLLGGKSTAIRRNPCRGATACSKRSLEVGSTCSPARVPGADAGNEVVPMLDRLQVRWKRSRSGPQPGRSPRDVDVLLRLRGGPCRAEFHERSDAEVFGALFLGVPMRGKVREPCFQGGRRSGPGSSPPRMPPRLLRQGLPRTVGACSADRTWVIVLGSGARDLGRMLDDLQERGDFARAWGLVETAFVVRPVRVNAAPLRWGGRGGVRTATPAAEDRDRPARVVITAAMRRCPRASNCMRPSWINRDRFRFHRRCRLIG